MIWIGNCGTTLRKMTLGMPGWLSDWASAFGSGHDPGIPGSSPTSGSLHGACFSLCLCLCLSLCLSWKQIKSLNIYTPLKAFFKKRFYLFMRERERGRDRGRGRSRLPARRLMWDSIPEPGITHWAKGRGSTAELPRHPFFFFFKIFPSPCLCSHFLSNK